MRSRRKALNQLVDIDRALFAVRSQNDGRARDVDEKDNDIRTESFINSVAENLSPGEHFRCASFPRKQDFPSYF